MSLPAHAVMMQTLPISELIKMVAAAALTALPVQASQTRLRPERMSASRSANALRFVRRHAACSSGPTCGQISRTRFGSTQTRSTEDGVIEIAAGGGAVRMRYRERSV